MQYRFGPSEKLDFADNRYTPRARPPGFPEVLLYTGKIKYMHIILMAYAESCGICVKSTAETSEFACTFSVYLLY